MPDEREGVPATTNGKLTSAPPVYFLPEYEVWISPCLAGVHLVSSIVLGQGHFHELGSVQSEGEYSDGDDVDQQSLGVAHCLENISTFNFGAQRSLQ